MSWLQTQKTKLSNFLNKGNKADFSDDTESLNNIVESRNKKLIWGILITLICVGYLFSLMNKPKSKPVEVKPVEFGTVINEEFVNQDIQSAEIAGVVLMEDLKKQLTKLQSRMNEKELEYELQRQKDKNEYERKLKALEAEQKSKLSTVSKTNIESVGVPVAQGTYSTPSTLKNQTKDPFAYDHTPRYEDAIQVVEAQKKHNIKPKQVTSMPSGIESFSFTSNTKSKRSIENYVTAGSFVTAVMIGGAEANAGVSGESNTSPVVFRTLNNGFLPNGKKSTLKGCIMTGSAYGDISSSRGIVRGDRFSCIRKNGDILDIPVEATVFNFGKNGIRGDAIMRNSKIVQSVGTAGLIDAIGSAAESLSQTTSVSALGSTTSVNNSDIPLNIAGTTSSDVASKLSDYYLKLAEKYHPDIDLKQGAIVNIVFLKGFPLNPEDHEEYEAEIARDRNNNQGGDIISTITNPLLLGAQVPKSSPLNPSFGK